MGPVTEALRAVEDTLADPACWTQGSYHDGMRSCLVGTIIDHAVIPSYKAQDQVDALIRDILTYETWGTECPTGLNDADDMARRLGLPGAYDAVMLLLATALDVAEAESL